MSSRGCRKVARRMSVRGGEATVRTGSQAELTTNETFSGYPRLLQDLVFSKTAGLKKC
jgi:hypothetical protein